MRPKAGAPEWLGLSPVIWLLVGGGVVLLLFLTWENHRIARGREPLLDPALLRIPELQRRADRVLLPVPPPSRSVLRRATVPVRRTRALGDRDGVRLLPLSVTLLLAAVGVPKLFPNASPRRVVQIGFVALFAGIVVFFALLDIGAGPEIVTWPMLLAGLGIGALASQLGAVTVSSVPDERTGEVGGVQNTMTNLGASIGTALAGAVLISALSASFFTGIENNPDVPDTISSKANVELTSGVPFVSDKDLEAALDEANVPPAASDAIVEENANARIDGLRAALAVLALISLVALYFSRRLPTKQPATTDQGSSA